MWRGTSFPLIRTGEFNLFDQKCEPFVMLFTLWIVSHVTYSKRKMSGYDLNSSLYYWYFEPHLNLLYVWF